MAISVVDALDLPVQECLHVDAQIWDSIAESPDAIGLTAETKRLLAERLEAHGKDRSAGSAWAEVKARILKE